MTLLCALPPLVDESGFGYYRRLTAANALWSWRDPAGAAGVAPTRNALINSPQLLAERLGLEPAWTHQALLFEHSPRKWRGLRRVRMDAVCPACLAESPYIRQPCRVVASEHLLRFRQTYIPVADLARAMGTTSVALSDQLSGLDVIGAKLLPNGARRGGHLRLADIGHRAVERAPLNRSYVDATPLPGRNHEESR